MGARLIICSCMLLFVAFGWAQPASFYKVFSGNGYDRAEGLTQLPDSSYLITGASSSFEDAPSQAFLLNIDKEGNYLWSKAYGGSEFDEGKRVFSIENYGHFIVGTSSSGDSHDFDAYAVFTNATGDQQWEKFYNYGRWERVHNAMMLEDSSIVVIGETDSTDNGATDFYMFRIDHEGEVLWTKKWGTAGDDFLKGITMMNDTTFAICGSKYVEDSLVNKSYIASFHIDGTKNWDSTYCSNGWAELNDIHYNNSFLRAVGQSRRPGRTQWDYHRMEVSADAITLLEENANYTVEGSLRYACFTEYTASTDGKLFLIRQMEDPGFPTYPDGEDDICSLYSSDFLWQNHDMGYSNGGQDQVNQIIPTKDGYAAFVGYHSYYCCGGSSLFIVKIGDESYYPDNVTNPVIYDMVSVDEMSELQGVSAFPNPFSDELHLTFDTAGEVTVIVLDELGREVMRSSTTTQELTLPTTELPKGYYVVRVIAEQGTATLEVVK